MLENFQKKDAKILIAWFEENKRDFPWRKDPSPYKVWISEIMLQQTRAETVVSYFLAWMKNFSDIFLLSQAPLEKILRIWEGLGYYKRARDIHFASKEIVEKFRGKIPKKKEDLLKIRGIGEYTQAAILSFGYKKRALVLDTNVARFLSRFFLIKENFIKKRKIFLDVLDQILPKKKAYIFSEALIEFGALVCRGKPSCKRCFFKKRCKAYLCSSTDTIFWKKKKEYQKLLRMVGVIECRGFFLLKKNRGKLFKGLYDFFYVDKEKKFSVEEMKRYLEKKYGLQVEYKKSYLKILQSFTKYRAELFPMHFKIKEKKDISGFSWIAKKRFEEIVFSSGHRKIEKMICL